MGIRFYCPNGHKLNVKSFLAGKRGLCPHCGTSVRIPTESQIPSRRERARGEGAATGSTRGRPILQLPKPASAASQELGTGVTMLDEPALATAGDAAAEPPQVPVAETAQPSADGSGLALPLVSVEPVPPAEKSQVPGTDPIGDAPQAVWYVRPPSGGQYGPAPGTIMRQWISEGRVSNDSLVWREAWSEWQAAGDVFSELRPSKAASTSDVGSAVVLPNGWTASKSSRSTAVATQRSRRTHSAASIAVVALGGLSLLLLVVLIFIIMR